ncbi:MAG: hypothetical protein JO189_18425 [Deltaproteobacteria bacterium]|nr:hypothetical protein [Deltaproteobacteria bacterium]
MLRKFWREIRNDVITRAIGSAMILKNILRLRCGAYKSDYGAHRENQEQTARKVSANTSFPLRSFSFVFLFHNLSRDSSASS